MADPVKPAFKEPTPAINKQWETFQEETQGWRDPGSIDLGIAPNGGYDDLLKAHKNLLEHYVEVNGQKTHLVKILFDEANRTSGVSRNYFRYGRMVQHPDAQAALIAAALDPTLMAANQKPFPAGDGLLGAVGKIANEEIRQPLGWEMLKMAVKKRDYEFATKLIDAGVRLTDKAGNVHLADVLMQDPAIKGDKLAPVTAALFKRMDKDGELKKQGSWRLLQLAADKGDTKTVIALLEAGIPMKDGNIHVTDIITRNTSFSAADTEKIIVAVLKRMNEGGKKEQDARVGWNIVEWAATSKHYALTAKLVNSGFPIEGDRRGFTLLNLLRANKTIPEKEAKLLSEALAPRIGDNPVMLSFFLRDHDKDSKWLDLYADKKKKLPDEVLRLAEQMALVESFRVTQLDARADFAGNAIDELLSSGKGVTVFDGMLKDKAKGNSPLIRHTDGFKQLVYNATHLPMDFLAYDSTDAFFKAVDEEAAEKNTGKTPMGKVLLDVEKRYAKALADNKGNEEAAKKALKETLQKELDDKRKEYRFSDKAWKNTVERLDDHRILSEAEHKKLDFEKAPWPVPPPDVKPKKDPGPIGMGNTVPVAVTLNEVTVPKLPTLVKEPVLAV